MVFNSDTLFVAEAGSNLVRRVSVAGLVSTFATLGGRLAGIAVDNTSNIYVSEFNNNRGTQGSSFCLKESEA